MSDGCGMSESSGSPRPQADIRPQSPRPYLSNPTLEFRTQSPRPHLEIRPQSPRPIGDRCPSPRSIAPSFPYLDDEVPKTPSLAVAFVPPGRQDREGSIGSEIGSLGMISTASGEDLPYPGFLPTTMGFLTQESKIRLTCLRLITNPWFERISMMVIFLNCVTLGMYQPCVDDNCETYRCRILSKFDDAIFAFFTLEMLIKMIAMGVTGKGAYLADTWNRLDFFIVAAGAIEYCLVLESNMNLSAIRTIRVLRPLRAINRIPSMRILVMLLLDTLPMLGNVLLLCFFVFFIFGIVGVQLWKGMLRQRCFLVLPDNVTNITEPVTNYYNLTEVEKDYICTLPKDNGMHLCDSLPPYKNKDTGAVCNETVFSIHSAIGINACINWNQYYTECKAGDINPFQGAISFDNIGLAWVAIFLVISLEGWTDIMYYLQDGHSFWDWIYFVLLIVIGSFFMINLCLVVIATQFSETKKREMDRMKMERARFQSTSTLASGSMSDQTSCYAEIIKYIAHLARRAKRKFYSRYRQYKRRKREEPPKISIKKGRRAKKNSQAADETSGNGGGPIIIPSCAVTSSSLALIKNICPNQPPPNKITTPDGIEVPECRIITPRTPTGFPDIEATSSSPLRPVFLTIPTPNGETSGNELLPPSPGSGGSSPKRRKSSVLFSDVIYLHGHSEDTRNVCHSEKTTQTEPEEPLDPALFREPLTPISLAPPFPRATIRTSSRSPSNNESTGKGTLTCGELLALSGALSAALPTHLGIDSRSVHSLYSSLAKGVKHFSAPSLFYSDSAPVGLAGYSSTSDSRSQTDSDDSDEDWTEDEYDHRPSLPRRIFTRVRGWIKVIAEHRYFLRSILIAILINTLSMGIEYHNQPDELTQLVEMSNIIFSAIFAFEMLLKIIAEGPFGYISNGFNVFDGVIVVLSIIELYESSGEMEQGYDSNQGSGLSVLRTFRLLRILKLVRFLPQLRRQLYVMLRTMDNVAIFFSLLVLFIFIFSILGMNLFGCKFCDEHDDQSVTCDRKNFDSLLWASITVFQILTQEDWNIVLFNGMSKTSHWASLYFVALMTFGNYVLFNLLVAILVEGFSAEEEKKRSRLSLEQQNDEEKNKIKAIDDKKQDDGGHLRANLVQDEPKCNIAKENKLLQQPKLQQERSFSDPSGASYIHLSCPPVITTTAATPQGSPHPSLDAYRNAQLNNRLTPSMALYCHKDKSQNLSHSSLAQSNLSSSGSLKGSQKSGSVRQGGVRVIARRESLSPNNGRQAKSSLSPSGSFRARSNSSSGSPLAWRRNSSRRKRTGSASSNSNKKQADCQSLVQDSGSEGEEETAVLNNNVTFNNNNLNNFLPQISSIDHSHCNGSMGAGGGTVGPRRSILTQQNSIGSPRTLSPQNSIRSRHSSPMSRHHSNPGQHAVKKEKDSKLTNLEIAGRETQFELECPSENERTVPSKICWLLEPKGCFLERNDYSLYLFAPRNPIRRLCVAITRQKWFDSSILFFIGLNCITLAMERPNIPPDSKERMFLIVCNEMFTVVFGLEMMVKVISAGLLYGEGAYFSSGWNIMDGSLVIISVVDFMMSLIATTTHRIFGILRVFRLLRALRPLRVINRAPGLKLVVQTLLSSLQPIGNIVLICCTFFIIFGILGVQLFKGAFYYCDGPYIMDVVTKDDCLNDTRNSWINRKYNFDHLGSALMALFVLSSKDGWVNIMYTGIDAVGVDKQPVKNYSQWRLVYFISFLLLVGFFVLNMFVGVVVENFHRCREEQEKEEKARRAAKRAKQLEKKRKKMREPPYYSNYSKTRLFIHNMVTSKYFDLAIAAVIGLNVVTMALEYYQMPQKLEYALQIFNYFFTAVFILESAMKMIALGCKRYIKDNEESRWNQLDIVIVILSVVGIVLEEMENEIIPINPTIIRVMRVLRIARVLKLLKMAKGIRALLDTVMQALPQVGNLGLLFFLLFFIFAALGVELFGVLECDDDHPCQGLGEHAHFKNFGIAFLTLFRVATGDNWNGIMKDTIRDECSDEPDCLKNCCLYPCVAPIFFVIFVLMAQFVLVNVVVAVLMKHLEESHKQMEDEYDIDVEIERQLAQEEEDMAEIQENISNIRLQQEKDKTFNAMSPPNEPITIAIHKPVTKIQSLPDNFTYRGHRGSDPIISYYRATPSFYNFVERMKDVRYNNIPKININQYESRQGSQESSEIPFSDKERRESAPVQKSERETSLSFANPLYGSKDEENTSQPCPKYQNSQRPKSSPTPSSCSAALPSGRTSSMKSSRRASTPKDISLLKSMSRESSFKKVRLHRASVGDSFSSMEYGGSPISQRKQRQLKWYNQRKSSATSHKVSTDDSIAMSLRTSFDITSRFDVDSISCSMCSSDEISDLNRISSGSESSPFRPDNRASRAALAQQEQSSLFDDSYSSSRNEDPTLASSNSSLTADDAIPELPSENGTPMAEIPPDFPNGSELPSYFQPEQPSQLIPDISSPKSQENSEVSRSSCVSDNVTVPSLYQRRLRRSLVPSSFVSRAPSSDAVPGVRSAPHSPNPNRRRTQIPTSMSKYFLSNSDPLIQLKDHRIKRRSKPV